MKKIIIALAIIFSSNVLAVGSDGTGNKFTQVCYKVGSDGTGEKVGSDGTGEKVGSDGTGEKTICQVIPLQDNNFNF